uniref:Uncharacterized protein n=1 Tax=Oncorhynchus mykiss TaxID=8022 RepID=A0A8C7RIY7_ONCMY
SLLNWKSSHRQSHSQHWLVVEVLWLALGGYVEEYNNKMQIVGLEEESLITFDHLYPTTKIMWIPDSKGVYLDLLATSGDYLRI